jgi:hypothetical protein
MGPDLLKEVTEFFRKAKAKEIDAASLCGEGLPMSREPASLASAGRDAGAPPARSERRPGGPE